MRIDAYNKIEQVYQTTAKSDKMKKEKKVLKDDTLEISQTGKDIHIARQAVQETSDIREDKVNDLKERIANGTYDVSMSDVADKLVENFFGTMLQASRRRG